MNCPKCDGQLIQEKYSRVLIDRCDKCGGIWLDEPELDEIEDSVWSDDELKGSLETHESQSILACPKCGKTMVKFNYRYFDLELDTCPDFHGFWLDKGEEKRVVELIKKEKSDFERKIKAEDEWAISLGRIKSKTFMEKVKDFLRL